MALKINKSEAGDIIKLAEKAGAKTAGAKFKELGIEPCQAVNPRVPERLADGKPNPAYKVGPPVLKVSLLEAESAIRINGAHTASLLMRLKDGETAKGVLVEALGLDPKAMPVQLGGTPATVKEATVSAPDAPKEDKEKRTPAKPFGGKK
jgi:hypothetical protein